MIDNGFDFSLVPWRPVLENKIGREVMGMMRGEDISWQFSRAKTLGIGGLVRLDRGSARDISRPPPNL